MEGRDGLCAQRLEVGDFPAGRDIELGLADDYAVMAEAENPYVSESIWSKVVRLSSSIRRHTVNDAY